MLVTIACLGALFILARFFIISYYYVYLHRWLWYDESKMWFSDTQTHGVEGDKEFVDVPSDDEEKNDKDDDSEEKEGLQKDYTKKTLDYNEDATMRHTDAPDNTHLNNGQDSHNRSPQTRHDSGYNDQINDDDFVQEAYTNLLIRPSGTLNTAIPLEDEEEEDEDEEEERVLRGRRNVVVRRRVRMQNHFKVPLVIYNISLPHDASSFFYVCAEGF